MAVIAYFTTPAEDFIFEDVLAAQPNMRIQLETMVPTGSTLIPYCWITGGDIPAIEGAFEESSFIETARLLDQVDDEALFRLKWAQEFDGLIDTIRESEAVMLEGVGGGGEWSFRFRFPSYKQLSLFYQTCADNDIRLTLEKIHNPVEPRDMVGYGLTTRQRQALLAALELGYFEIPRRTTLGELGENFDVSDAAVSQRIRRGLGTLMSATLADELRR